MIEARNEHFKTIFKIFEHVFKMQGILAIIKIVEVIINRYHFFYSYAGSNC